MQLNRVAGWTACPGGATGLHTWPYLTLVPFAPEMNTFTDVLFRRHLLWISWCFLGAEVNEMERADDLTDATDERDPEGRSYLVQVQTDARWKNRSPVSNSILPQSLPWQTLSFIYLFPYWYRLYAEHTLLITCSPCLVFPIAPFDLLDNFILLSLNICMHHCVRSYKI